MSDYIKRSDAIDACCRGWNNTVEDCIRNIKEIPSAWYKGMECAQDIISAQPSVELTLQTPQTYGKSINPSNAEVVEDLISRADAIDAIDDAIDADSPQWAILRTKIGFLPSAEAVQIHNDGTLEVKVPNAHKVGRVLVMDTDSHIGGGLFYPDDAVEIVRCKDCKHHEKFLFDDSKLLCWVHDIDIVVSPTDYCSYGERREDGEEE